MESIAMKIFDLSALSALEEENERLPDPAERELRRALIERIWDSTAEYDAHILEYEYAEHLKELALRGIVLSPTDRDEAAAAWDALFASDIPESRKAQTPKYNEQYKWHIFSFRLKDALCGDAARAAFEAQEKDSVLLFYQLSPQAFRVEHAQLLKATDFEFDRHMNLADVYIYSPDEKWTYVMTHEDSCGPYFYRAQ